MAHIKEKIDERMWEYKSNNTNYTSPIQLIFNIMNIS